MKTLPIRLALSAVLALGLAAAAMAATAPALAGPVVLKAQRTAPQDSIQPFPLVLAGPAVTPAAADKINAALRRDHTLVEASAAHCRADAKESGSPPPSDQSWSRSVTVTMQGPRYLALMVSDSYYCGGPYPNDGNPMPLVYDLTTGAPVNWIRLFPPGATAAFDNASDGARTGVLIWPELTRRAKAAADMDCQDALDAAFGRKFQISLDAKTGMLEAAPSDLPHVVQACADPVQFDVQDLRKLGFAAELVDALAAAHRAKH